MDAETRNIRIKLLEEVGLGAAAGDPLDVDAIAATLGLSEPTTRMELDQLQHLGLYLEGEVEDSPLLLAAGSQFLARGGDVDAEDLRFLPRVVDDLHAREALRVAGTVLVELPFRTSRGPYPSPVAGPGQGCGGVLR